MRIYWRTPRVCPKTHLIKTRIYGVQLYRTSSSRTHLNHGSMGEALRTSKTRIYGRLLQKHGSIKGSNIKFSSTFFWIYTENTGLCRGQQKMWNSWTYIVLFASLLTQTRIYATIPEKTLVYKNQLSVKIALKCVKSRSGALLGVKMRYFYFFLFLHIFALNRLLFGQTRSQTGRNPWWRNTKA